MKIFRILTIMLCFAATFSLANCSGGHSHDTDETGKERTSAYICPMYCAGSGSEQPGKCPACKMDYVANEKKTDEAGHNHDDHGHDHDSHGHNHDGHDHDHGAEGHSH